MLWDFEDMNFVLLKNLQVFFMQKIVCVRFIIFVENVDGFNLFGFLLEEVIFGYEIDGIILIDYDMLKWRCNGKKVVDLKF